MDLSGASLSLRVWSPNEESVFSSYNVESYVKDLDLKGFSGAPCLLLSLPVSAAFQMLERGKPFCGCLLGFLHWLGASFFCF